MRNFLKYIWIPLSVALIFNLIDNRFSVPVGYSPYMPFSFFKTCTLEQTFELGCKSSLAWWGLIGNILFWGVLFFIVYKVSSLIFGQYKKRTVTWGVVGLGVYILLSVFFSSLYPSYFIDSQNTSEYHLRAYEFVNNIANPFPYLPNSPAGVKACDDLYQYHSYAVHTFMENVFCSDNSFVDEFFEILPYVVNASLYFLYGLCIGWLYGKIKKR
jgi:hypothetical protein